MPNKILESRNQMGTQYYIHTVLSTSKVFPTHASEFKKKEDTQILVKNRVFRIGNKK
jgi:hypothetical protein